MKEFTLEKSFCISSAIGMLGNSSGSWIFLRSQYSSDVAFTVRKESCAAQFCSCHSIEGLKNFWFNSILPSQLKDIVDSLKYPLL